MYVCQHDVLSSCIAFLESRSPPCTAFVLHSIIPLLPSGMQKKEKKRNGKAGIL